MSCLVLLLLTAVIVYYGATISFFLAIGAVPLAILMFDSYTIGYPLHMAHHLSLAGADGEVVSSAQKPHLSGLCVDTRRLWHRLCYS